MTTSKTPGTSDTPEHDASPEISGKGAEEFFQIGLLLSRNKRTKDALIAFRKAVDLVPNEPRYWSFYGLGLASVGKRPREGLRLCELAVKREFYRPELHLNLGKVLVLTGRLARARKAFLHGQALDPQNPDIRLALQGMGVRKQPVFPFLDRKNLINKWAGLLRHRLRPPSKP